MTGLKEKVRNWRPIATAPVGEDVLLFSPDANPEILVGHKFNDEPGMDGDPIPDFYPQHESYRGGMPFDVGFTHWMPLPEPPESLPSQSVPEAR